MMLMIKERIQYYDVIVIEPQFDVIHSHILDHRRHSCLENSKVHYDVVMKCIMA